MVKLKEKGTAATRKVEKEVPKEALEMAAYFHWLNRGCPENDALTDWVEAESRIKGAAPRG